MSILLASVGHFQYTAYWDSDRVFVLARRDLRDNTVQTFRLEQFTLTSDDPHRNTCLGISPGDGRLHLSWDHHNNPLHYTRSRAGFITEPPKRIAPEDIEPVQPITDDTELTGPMKLRLWVEAKAARGDLSPPDDMAIFVAVNKLDDRGRTVHFLGSAGNRYDLVTRGFCRVSRRELDVGESTDYQPVLTGTSHLPLEPNQIVPVEIELYPSSTFFAAGESLELIISSNEIIPSPPFRKDVSINRGIHVIHCGGDHDSNLLVPIIPAPSPR